MDTIIAVNTAFETVISTDGFYHHTSTLSGGILNVCELYPERLILPTTLVEDHPYIIVDFFRSGQVSSTTSDRVNESGVLFFVQPQTSNSAYTTALPIAHRNLLVSQTPIVRKIEFQLQTPDGSPFPCNTATVVLRAVTE